MGATQSSTQFGDAEAAGNQLIARINQTGGIAGRPVETTYHATNLESSSWAAQGQAACADFAEDHHVFAVVSGFVGGGAGSLAACLAQDDVPLLAPDRSPYGLGALHDYPSHLYLLGRLTMQRWARAYVDGLAQLGWYHDAVVGLISFDRPEFIRTLEDVVLPRLSQLGGNQAEDVQVTFPSSASDLGTTSAQIQNAIMRSARPGSTTSCSSTGRGRSRSCSCPRPTRRATTHCTGSTRVPIPA